VGEFTSAWGSSSTGKRRLWKATRSSKAPKTGLAHGDQLQLQSINCMRFLAPSKRQNTEFCRDRGPPHLPNIYQSRQHSVNRRAHVFPLSYFLNLLLSSSSNEQNKDQDMLSPRALWRHRISGYVGSVVLKHVSVIARANDKWRIWYRGEHVARLETHAQIIFCRYTDPYTANLHATS
jgi:hypothetical protein